MPISTQAQSKIESALDNVTSKGQIPGMVFVSVDRSGDLIASHCSGKIGNGKPTPMSLDTVFWIASCTKMITGLACMQMVEQGKISLDDPHALYRIVPELKDKKVLQPDGSLVEKKRDITLRMLLNHTAGFGFPLSNKKLRDWSRPAGFDELETDAKQIRELPLVNQPGETWEYGVRLPLSPTNKHSSLTINVDEHRPGRPRCRRAIWNVSRRILPEVHLRAAGYQEYGIFPHR